MLNVITRLFPINLDKLNYPKMDINFLAFFSFPRIQLIKLIF
jgi:hypothetical protein